MAMARPQVIARCGQFITSNAPARNRVHFLHESEDVSSGLYVECFRHCFFARKEIVLK